MYYIRRYSICELDQNKVPLVLIGKYVLKCFAELEPKYQEDKPTVLWVSSRCKYVGHSCNTAPLDPKSLSTK